MDYSIVKYTYAEIGKLRAWLIFKILNFKKKKKTKGQNKNTFGLSN